MPSQWIRIGPGRLDVGDDVTQRVANLLALEVRIGEVLDGVPRVVEEHADMGSAFGRFRAQAIGHREALRARLQFMKGSVPGSAERFRPAAEPSSVHTGGPEAPSETLETLHRLVSQAAFGYSILHAVAHRHYDSKGEGNTADLAENHFRDYAGVLREIHRLVSEVAVWDLVSAGQECQCKCPSCGLGVCLCSPHGTNTVADIWREMASAGAEQATSGIRVRPPRIESAAHRAGLQPGDVIVAVDDRDIANETWDAISTIQDTIGKHQSGETIRFRVKRASGDLEEISVVRQ